MITSLLNAFGMGGSPEVPLLHPRQINLSGNVFQFQIPEDFSGDMPAEDLIEKVDLYDPSFMKGDDQLTLMRRWWDIKKSGFFGKAMGSMMMAISIRPRPENQAGILKAAEYDFHSMLHFVTALYDSLDQRYEDHNREVLKSDRHGMEIYVPFLVTQIGETVYPNYKGVSINGIKWVLTGTGISLTGQIDKIYATPLNNSFFLEVEFSLMPNDDVIAREFVDLAMIRVNRIVETFRLGYAEGNEFDRVTGKDWIDKTVLDELESSKDQFIPKLKQ